MADNLYIKRSDDVAARMIGDELMIMSARDSSLYSLNETAALLWQSADGLTPLSEIVERQICAGFEVDPVTAMQDAKEVVADLAQRGILSLSTAPAATKEQES